MMTDGDAEFMDRLADTVKEPAENNRGKKWLWAIPAGAAACAAALTVGLLVPSDGGPEAVKYDTKNFVQTDSSLTELDGALSGVAMHVMQEHAKNIKRTYDSVSKDDMFFTLNVEEVTEDVFYKFNAVVVVNGNYDLEDFEFEAKTVTETYSDFTVEYSRTVEHDSDTEMNLVRCTARIEHGKYKIYIMNYKEYSSENGTFLEVLDRLFDFS